VQAARFMCITRELEVQALEEDGFQKKKMELEKRWKMAAEQVDLKEKEIRFLKEESEDLKNKVVKLSKDKQDLEGRIVDLCVEKAKAQAELLALGVKFDKMDLVKVVYNGELIDMTKCRWRAAMITILPNDMF
ncbi:hypothetical protein PIB30_092380, partial [Stylosanthes scabra]|nr:hypothetical protein [Stylosanthes scabra]